MQTWLKLLVIVSLPAASMSLLGCTTGKPLPAGWPHIGLTLPGRAEVKNLSEAFEPYTKDGIHAHFDDGEAEVWAVCFTCPGGITQANIHVDSKLKRSGFSAVTGADFPFKYAGGITGYYGSTYLWVSKDKQTGVSLSFLDDLSERAKEKTGDLCLMVIKESAGADGPSGHGEASSGLY